MENLIIYFGLFIDTFSSYTIQRQMYDDSRYENDFEGSG
jgi:hypothetical protein